MEKLRLYSGLFNFVSMAEKNSLNPFMTISQLVKIVLQLFLLCEIWDKVFQSSGDIQ